MAAGSRHDDGTEPRIGVHRTRVPCALTRVVLTACALFVVPGYRLLYFRTTTPRSLEATYAPNDHTHARTLYTSLTLGPIRHCPSYT